MVQFKEKNVLGLGFLLDTKAGKMHWETVQSKVFTQQSWTAGEALFQPSGVQRELQRRVKRAGKRVSMSFKQPRSNRSQLYHGKHDNSPTLADGHFVQKYVAIRLLYAPCRKKQATHDPQPIRGTAG